jgi:hypothetical protein
MTSTISLHSLMTLSSSSVTETLIWSSRSREVDRDIRLLLNFLAEIAAGGNVCSPALAFFRRFRLAFKESEDSPSRKPIQIAATREIPDKARTGAVVLEIADMKSLWPGRSSSSTAMASDLMGVRGVHAST